MSPRLETAISSIRERGLDIEGEPCSFTDLQNVHMHERGSFELTAFLSAQTSVCAAAAPTGRPPTRCSEEASVRGVRSVKRHMLSPLLSAGLTVTAG